ncbi:MAG: hypothetical protein O3C20_20715 [Verrucomicrobia bacterium]|nr:hypothetical protein [Verrucomicrobiota bacterium]
MDKKAILLLVGILVFSALSLNAFMSYDLPFNEPFSVFFKWCFIVGFIPVGYLAAMFVKAIHKSAKFSSVAVVWYWMLMTSGGLVMVWCAVTTSVIYINAIESREVVIKAKIVDKHFQKKHEQCWFSYETDYRDSIIRFSVSKGDFDRYQIGDSVEFTKIEGLLGILYAKR